MYNSAFRKIEHYLYKYNLIDMQIQNLRNDICNDEYNQTYRKYITNKSSSLEDQVIKNINLERRILKISKWKKLISLVLKKYKENKILNYEFINLKYFYKASPTTIQEKLNLNEKEQKDIQAEILQYIFFVAIKNEMLKEVDY